MKFNKDNYRFIDLSETDHTQFSQLELDKMIADTIEVLEMTKGKIKSSPMNLGLAGGLLAVRDGQFKKINAFASKWDKGSATKEECKLLKKVFSTAQLYYAFKVIIVLISKEESSQDLFKPTLVQKIED